MKKLAFLLVALLTCGSLTGCGPRGETKTLAEILDIAKQEFSTNVGHVQDPQISAQLQTVSQSLEKMLSGETPAVKEASGIIADKFSELIHTAGYTSRPGMTELMAQYRQLQIDAGAGSLSGARLRLLAARTYSTLASEAGSTAFQIKPLYKPKA